MEDNALNLEIARELIGLTGIEIDEAGTAREAVRTVADALRALRSGADGRADARHGRLRGHPADPPAGPARRPDSPIIAMTANAFLRGYRSRAALRDERTSSQNPSTWAWSTGSSAGGCSARRIYMEGARLRGPRPFRFESRRSYEIRLTGFTAFCYTGFNEEPSGFRRPRRAGVQSISRVSRAAKAAHHT